MIYVQYSIQLGNRSFIFNGCHDDIITQYHIKNEKFYELDEMEFIAHILQSVTGDAPFCMVDAGANIGNHSIYFSCKFPHAIVHSFEMNPVTFNLLKNSIKMNDIDNIIPYNLGLYDKEGNCGCMMPKGNVLGGARLNLDEVDGAVKLVPLDSVDFGGDPSSLSRSMWSMLKHALSKAP